MSSTRYIGVARLGCIAASESGERCYVDRELIRDRARRVILRSMRRHSGRAAIAARAEIHTPGGGYGFRVRATDLGFTRDRQLNWPKSAKADLGGAPRNDSGRG